MHAPVTMSAYELSILEERHPGMARIAKVRRWQASDEPTLTLAQLGLQHLDPHFGEVEVDAHDEAGPGPILCLRCGHAQTVCTCSRLDE